MEHLNEKARLRIDSVLFGRPFPTAKQDWSHDILNCDPCRNRSGKWTQKKIISCLSLSEIETTRHVVNSSVTQEELRLDSSKGDMEPFESFAPDWMRYVFLPQNTGGARGECSPGTGRRHCLMEKTIFLIGFPCGRERLNNGVSSDCSIPWQMAHEVCGEAW